MFKKLIQKVLVLSLLFITVSTYAQQGTVRGTLTDQSTGELLMFANVVVDGTDPLVGSQTDLDGKYELKVAPGTYILTFSYVGYTDQKVSEVEVKEGEVTVVDFNMSPEGITLDEEVVIKAGRIDRTENAILTLQMKAPGIQDGISAQEISRFGANNAAESMKRVTGASVVDGKFVLVRGLGDRYSSAQLNGQQLPSTDPYRNASPLDLIPANLVDNIIASKTFTADQPGNFTGGNINIQTKSFPERFTLAASISSTYNTQSSFQDDFLTYQGGDTDWLGYDDGFRERPAILKDEAVRDVLDNQAWIFGFGDPEIRETIGQASDAVNPQFSPTMTESPMDYGASFSIGNQFNVANRPLGVIFNMNYRRSFTHYNNGRDTRWELLQGADDLNLNRDLVETRSVDNPVVGGLFGLSYKVSPTNKISFNAIYNHNAEKQSIYSVGPYPGIISGSGTFETRQLSWQEREFRSYQLQGEHVFVESGIELEWGAGLVNSTQDEPDLRLFANEFRIRNDELVYFISPAEYDLPFHFWRELEDNQYQGKVDLTIPFAKSKSTANKIKIGGSYRKKERSFFEDRWQMFNFNRVQPYDGSDDFFARNSGLIGDNNDQVGIYPTEQLDPANSYDGEDAVTAGYAMITYDWPKFKIIAGARVENTDISVVSRDTSQDEGSINKTDILPSLSTVYRLKDNMNLRFSATQTLARPNMRELAPFTAFDNIGGDRITGNPELERTLVQNLDLRWEWFQRPGEVYAVSAYFKNFDNPIVRAFLPRAANPEVKFQNVDNAIVYGVEFELRKKLDFIAPALEKLKFNANFSIIKSEVDIPGSPDEIDSEQNLIEKFNPEKGFTRPFPGQSDFLLNVGLNYTDVENGWDALISFNMSGERLALISPSFNPDIYEKPFPQLDISIRKSITDKLGIKLSAENLLNPNFERYMPYNDKEFPIQKYKRGISFGFSLSYTI